MKVTFQAIDGSEITFTAFEDRLLFLHSDVMSAQLVLNEIGVQITRQPKNIKVGFLTRTEAYHSFYFKLDEFFELVGFFKLLGFPLHGIKPNETFDECENQQNEFRTPPSGRNC